MASPTAVSGSPFIDAFSFEPEAATNGMARHRPSSPFIEAFIQEGAADGYDRLTAERRILMAELHDEELEDAIYELVNDAAARLGEGESARAGLAALELEYAPFVDELEAALQRVEDELGGRDPSSVTEAELDEVLGRMEMEYSVNPAFEQLFGALKGLVKKAVGGAAKLAKKGIAAAAKLGLGPILSHLRKLVRPLIKRVLQAAINRLPAALQPIARKLASNPTLMNAELEDAEEPAVDVGAIQQEFDEQIAGLLLGEGAVELEEESYAWSNGSQEAVGIAGLDAARDRFMAELAQLEHGDEAGPAIDRFVPAVLPAIRLGVRIVGRKRVVGLLSGLIAKLIGPMVGSQAARALSNAVADSGLKLLGMEVTPDDEAHTARSAVAATIEDTLREVAALPAEVLDSEVLLEGAVLNAFEHAAAANFPPMLPAAVYRRRPDLIETDGHQGTWIPLPLRGPKRFKKFSRVARTRITPRMAMAIPVFGNAPLALFLQEHLGLEAGEELEADVHMYEAMPGMLLSDVARYEGDGGAVADEFHPLTPEAAALIAGEPGLGRASARMQANGPRCMGVGQRFFRIAVPGRRTAPGRRGRRRSTGLRTVIDFPGNRIVLRLYLAERRAQEMAAALRRQGHAGAVATTLKSIIDRHLSLSAGGNAARRIRIIHEALELDEARGKALQRLPAGVAHAFTARVATSTLSALADFLSKHTARFVAATEDAKDGITLVITLSSPPDLPALRKVMGGAAAPAVLTAGGAPATVQVDVQPGFANG